MADTPWDASARAHSAHLRHADARLHVLFVNCRQKLIEAFASFHANGMRAIEIVAKRLCASAHAG